MAIREGIGWSRNGGPWRFNPPFLRDGIGDGPRIGPRIFMEDLSPHEGASFILYLLADVVVDEAGNPVVAATLNLFDSLTNVLLQTTITDGLGAYSFATGYASQDFYIVGYTSSGTLMQGTTARTLRAV